LETGSRDRASWVVARRNVRFVLSSALVPDPQHPIAAHVARHGDGVKDIALHVADAKAAYLEAVRRGATGVQEPIVYEDGQGRVVRASIATYGETVHSFVERHGVYAQRGLDGPFMPGFQAIQNPPPAPDTGIAAIDHIVGNVELGHMEQWVAFYRDVLGFKQMLHFDDADISTEYSALMSKVMANGTGKIKFPINEPADGLRKSQIEEYLDFYGGPGAQHIALATGDILASVDALREHGMVFLRVPDSYYAELEGRVGQIDEQAEDLATRGVLVDRDDEGYLLQIFSQPVQDRPTLFYEIIQRKGSRGFGKGNFKALFQALEREQDLRGNL
ncbi:MAG: 4-hydroxyphenylpyruvate dioxygenase, partial [Roseiflexaceae bacterium]|nr:4-hydroxyphenylpyruvate dioxygenase [Roseiflexaceae bacterium]